MELDELRTWAIQCAEAGDRAPLAELVRANRLNSLERELVAQMVEGTFKHKRGPKPSPKTAERVVEASLIHFWRDRDGWKRDAILREIEVRFDVANTMARKYLEASSESPKALLELSLRKMFVLHGSKEDIETIRNFDFST